MPSTAGGRPDCVARPPPPPLTPRSHPLVFLVLHLPMGIVSGYTTVLFPFLANAQGMSVAMTTSLVAIGLFAQSIRVFWAPFADTLLTLKAWCYLGVGALAIVLMATAMVPPSPSNAVFYGVALFLLNVMGCIENTPVAGLLAYNVAEEDKGKASGFYMAGAMMGSACAGSAGIWLVAHTGSAALASLALGLGCGASLLALRWVKEPPRQVEGLSAGERLRPLLLGTWEILRGRRGAYVALLFLTPVGLGATGNFWPAIAPEWHVSADMMAFVAGIGTTVATLLGCLMGGYFSDRRDAVGVFMAASGMLCAFGFAMAFGPRSPGMFGGLSLGYMLCIGVCNAAYGAVIYRIVGRESASFKYQTFNSIGNIPSAYMTAVNGAVHDRIGSAAMLNVEAAVCVALIAAFVGARRLLKI
jgi:MFS transporter, PAT family, beta-lactamase induction signal transducer AmpG